MNTQDNNSLNKAVARNRGCFFDAGKERFMRREPFAAMPDVNELVEWLKSRTNQQA